MCEIVFQLNINYAFTASLHFDLIWFSDKPARNSQPLSIYSARNEAHISELQRRLRLYGTQ